MEATNQIPVGGMAADGAVAGEGSRPTTKMCKTILGFVPVESPIYTLHPATRIVVYLFMSFLPLMFQMPELQLLLVLVSVAMYVWCGVPARNLEVYAPMMVLVFLFISFSYVVFPTKAPGEVPFQLGFLTLYGSSLLRGLLVYLRVVALLFATIVYFATNRERDILVGLRTMHVPFVVSYFLGLVLRSASMFLDDYRIVKEAEKARGLDMASAPLPTKVTHFPMYMIPLFTLAIRRSEDVSVGLYAKGTEIMAGTPSERKGPRPDYMRTFYHMTVLDWGVIVALCGIFVAIAVLSLGFDAFPLSHSILYGLLG